MIIAKANIQLAARHDYREQHQVTERLEFWQGNPAAAPPQTSAPPAEPAVAVDFSAAGSLLAMHRGQQVVDLSTPMDARDRLNMMILSAMYKAITGEEIQLLDPSLLVAKNPGEAVPLALEPGTPPAAQVQAQVQAPGMLYQRQERYSEQETLRFAAQGQVHTADGRALDISVALTMSRQFVQESSLSLQLGAAKIDPLVINFDGTGVGLTQTRFAFDLDSDGSTEQIASLRPGNGYLVLDRNGDGVVNNGTELFGPSSGRGFQELAAFDEDGNHFIDEGDSIYQQLRIWLTHEDGSSQLVALGDKQVGAIYLGHVSSPFQLKDVNNQSLGEVANSSIYLTEQGRVGVVQEVNLTV